MIIKTNEEFFDAWYIKGILNNNNFICIEERYGTGLEIYKLNFPISQNKIQTIPLPSEYGEVSANYRIFNDKVTGIDYIVISRANYSGDPCTIYKINPAASTPAVFHVKTTFMVESIYDDMAIGGYYGDVPGTIPILNLSTKTITNINTVDKVIVSPILNSNLCVYSKSKVNGIASNHGICRINKNGTITEFNISSTLSQYTISNSVYSHGSLYIGDTIYVPSQTSFTHALMFSYNGTSLTFIKEHNFPKTFNSYDHRKIGSIGILMRDTTVSTAIYNDGSVETYPPSSIVDQLTGVMYNRTSGKFYKPLNGKLVEFSTKTENIPDTTADTFIYKNDNEIYIFTYEYPNQDRFVSYKHTPDIPPIDPSVNDEIPIDGNYKYSYSLDDVPLSNGFETRLDAVYAAGNTDIVALYRQVTSNSTDKHVSIFKYNGNGEGQEYYSYRDQYDGFNGNWAVITEDGKKFISARKGEIVILDENFQLDFTISGFLFGSSYGQWFDVTADGKYMVTDTVTYPYIRVYKVDYINKTATLIPSTSFSGSGSNLSDTDTCHIKFSKNGEYIFAMIYSRNTSTYINIAFKRTDDTFTRINIEGSMCTHAYVAGFHGVISGDGRTLVTGGGQKTTNNLQIEELTLTIHRLINGVYKPIHTINDKGSGVPVYIAGLSINYNGSMIFINMDNPGQNTLLSRKKNMLIYDFNTNLYKRDADFDAFALANGFVSRTLSAWTSAYSFNKSGSKLFYINGLGTYSLGVLNISKEAYVEPTYNLTVNTTPADASFYIRVGAALSLQDKSKPIPLTAGEYYTNTIAKTDDYKDDVRTINITQDMTLDITLLRRPWVEFTVTPSDAVVMFNDAGTWVQGTKFRCLEGLTYEYTVSKTGFDTQIGTVVVGTEDIVRNITLVSNVRIDKEKRFPGTFKLLDITKPEYITEKGSVVIAGADKLVNIILKAANVYKVDFVLTPSNAIVELLSKGSILTGTSFNLTPGSYTYQIKCDGYISKSGEVVVIGEAKTITETLVEAIYQVSFTTTPAAAIVQVYYNNTWNSGKTHNLKKGSYQYRVTATDYTDKTGTIEVINANVTTNILLSSDGGVVTITNWTPTDAMSQMSPITEMFRLGKGLLPENNRLTYTLPKDKYQLKITSNQPQKYLPYYNKFELTGDKTINPVFRENAIDWSTMAPYLEDNLGDIVYDGLHVQLNKILINNNQIIFTINNSLIRLLKSGSKFIYQKITDTLVTDPTSSFANMRSSSGNEIFAVDCNRETYINRVSYNNINNIGKVNDFTPLYITDNGLYVIGCRYSSSNPTKLLILTTNPFVIRPAIEIAKDVYNIDAKCSEDGTIIVLSATDNITKSRINLLYKYNNGTYQEINLSSDIVQFTEINSIGVIGSTHIAFNSNELHSYDPYYDIFKIDNMSLVRLVSNNSVYTSNGVPMYRLNAIGAVISTPDGLICYRKISASSTYYSYYTLTISGIGYNTKSHSHVYNSDMNSLSIDSYSIPRYNKNKKAMYFAVKNIASLGLRNSIVNSPLLIFNKVFEIDYQNNIFPDILSKDLYYNINSPDVEKLLAISTDGNLVLTCTEALYPKIKNLKLYDLTNNSVSEYIP